ncbi:UNVERIFIED_CONTAM: hypothetical protein FKN15_028788 [Acipenser sinensis]
MGADQQPLTLGAGLFQFIHEGNISFGSWTCNKELFFLPLCSPDKSIQVQVASATMSPQIAVLRQLDAIQPSQLFVGTVILEYTIPRSESSSRNPSSWPLQITSLCEFCSRPAGPYRSHLSVNSAAVQLAPADHISLNSAAVQLAPADHISLNSAAVQLAPADHISLNSAAVQLAPADHISLNSAAVQLAPADHISLNSAAVQLAPADHISLNSAAVQLAPADHISLNSAAVQLAPADHISLNSAAVQLAPADHISLNSAAVQLAPADHISLNSAAVQLAPADHIALNSAGVQITSSDHICRSHLRACTPSQSHTVGPSSTSPQRALCDRGLPASDGKTKPRRIPEGYILN